MPGEVAKVGSLEAAISAVTKDHSNAINHRGESIARGYPDEYVAGNEARILVTDLLLVALNEAQAQAESERLSIIEEQAPPPAPTVAYKAKGTKVNPTYTPSDDGGTLDIAMKAKARAGSTVKIQVMDYNADKGRMVVVDTTKAKVGKGGKIHTAVEADAGDVIMVKKNTGKKLAQIEIPGQ